MCFCCGAGEFELSAFELAALDYREAIEACGRESGHCSDIYPRINCPYINPSKHLTSQRAGEALSVINPGAGGALELSEVQDVIEPVIAAMRELGREGKQQKEKAYATSNSHHSGASQREEAVHRPLREQRSGKNKHTPLPKPRRGGGKA